MSGILKSLVVLVFSSLSWAQSAPQDSYMYLWNGITDSLPAAGSKQFCATTKNQPFNPTLCMAELPRDGRYDLPKGYAKLQNGTRQETLTIKNVSNWKYLGTTTQYVQNSEIYTRELTLADSYGRHSIVTESFHFNPKFPTWFRKIMTKGIYGKLPDGTPVKLENIYFYY